MAAILSCRAMLNHRPLRPGCLIEFLYPTGFGDGLFAPYAGTLPRAHHGRFGYEPPAAVATSSGRVFRLVMISSTAPYSTA